MRPLVVLLLVLGSLAALLFALATMTTSGRDKDHGVGVEPVAADTARPRAELIAPQEDAPEKPRAASGEETRQAVRNDRDPGPTAVAYGAIEGIVVDRQGRPIPEAQVSLLNSKPSVLGEEIHALRGTEPPRPVSKAVTEADGKFRFGQLDPRKDWSLVASHVRYVSYTTEVGISVPEGGVWQETLIMELGQTATGVVRDAATGQPIEGARLVVELPFVRLNKKNSAAPMEAITDQNGVYAFQNVGANPAQGRSLVISAPGYATQVHTNFALTAYGEPPIRFKNVQPPGELEGRKMDFELEPGRVIAGRVVNPEQRGVAGVEIEAMSQSGTVSSQGWAKSSANGEFLIEGLAEGIYIVRVEASNYDAHPLQRVEAGQTDVVLELFELAVVTGKVIDSSGDPLTHFQVKARVANEISKAFGTVTAQRTVKDAKDGKFELRGVPEGSYVIEGVAEGYASCFSDTFTATQGLVTSDVVVRMTKGGSLRGRLVEAYGSTPIAGAEVATMDNDWVEGEIWELFGAMEPTAMTKTKVFTDADGRFAIDVVTPGVYQVQFKAKGYSPFAVRDVLVVEGQNTDVPTQTLIRGAVITGIVYGRAQSIQPGASVQLSPVEPNTEGHRSVRADATGRFVIDNARPGTYRLSATRPSSGTSNPFEAIADIRQSEIEVTVEDGGRHEFDLRIE